MLSNTWKEKFISHSLMSLSGVICTFNSVFAAPPAGLTDNMKSLGTAAQYQTGTVDEKSIFGLVGSLVGVFLGVLGVIFVILFITAGYHWMMAGGDTAKLDKAKDSMWRAIIGLLIIIGAYAIQQYVFMSI